MNKNKIVTAVLVLLLIGILWWVFSGKRQDSLVAPGLSRQAQQTLNPAPTPSTKTFQFDSSTDLKQELEKVDPKLLDSDF